MKFSNLSLSMWLSIHIFLSLSLSSWVRVPPHAASGSWVLPSFLFLGHAESFEIRMRSVARAPLREHRCESTVARAPCESTVARAPRKRIHEIAIENGLRTLRHPEIIVRGTAKSEVFLLSSFPPLSPFLSFSYSFLSYLYKTTRSVASAFPVSGVMQQWSQNNPEG